MSGRSRPRAGLGGLISGLIPAPRRAWNRAQVISFSPRRYQNRTRAIVISEEDGPIWSRLVVAAAADVGCGSGVGFGLSGASPLDL